MSGNDAARLREVAEEAARRHFQDARTGEPLPWVDGPTGRVFDQGAAPVADAYTSHDAAYIATFDPPTILALLDRLDAAEAAQRDGEAVVGRVRALLDDEPMFVSGIRRAIENNTAGSGRGGDITHTPRPGKRGSGSCPGDNLTRWLDEIRAALASVPQGDEEPQS